MKNNLIREYLYLKTLYNDQVLTCILRECINKRLSYNWIKNKIISDLEIEEKKVSDLQEDEINENINDQRIEEDLFYKKVQQELFDSLSDDAKAREIYSKHALFVLIEDDLTKHKIGVGLSLIFEKGLDRNEDGDLFFAYLALSMEHKFRQLYSQLIDQFYALIFVCDRPKDDDKRCEVIALSLWNHEFADLRYTPIEKSIQIIVSYLNDHNKKRKYIDLLNLLWQENRALNQKEKELQEKFRISISEELFKNLEQIEKTIED